MADFTNAETVAKWQRRAGLVGPEVRRAVQRIGERMLNTSRRHMQEQIYNIPEDTEKSGKNKWTRTGNLKNAERLEYAPDGSAVTLTNAMIYARARHELGRDGRKTKRPAHWRDGIFQELKDSTARETAAMNQRILSGR
jgi:hypothetical protein